MNMQALVESTIRATNEAMVKELKKNRMLKSNKNTAFQRTETLLYNYPKFQEALKSKLDEIAHIQEEGVPKRSKSIVQWNSNSSLDLTNEYEKAEYAIEKIKKSIVRLEDGIQTVCNALKAIQDDPYYEIIKMNYFEGQTREDIADYFGIDVSTVSRNKNRLVNVLQIRLFPQDAIEEMFGYA